MSEPKVRRVILDGITNDLLWEYHEATPLDKELVRQQIHAHIQKIVDQESKAPDPIIAELVEALEICKEACRKNLVYAAVKDEPELLIAYKVAEKLINRAKGESDEKKETL